MVRFTRQSHCHKVVGSITRLVHVLSMATGHLQVVQLLPTPNNRACEVELETLDLLCV